MSWSDLFARAVAVVGDGAVAWRRLQRREPPPALGPAPHIPAALPQGRIPTLKMPTAKGWVPGHKPTAAKGLAVRAFAADLQHPRWIQVLPNGDVTVSEATSKPGPVRSIFGHAIAATMRRAGALGESPDRITCCAMPTATAWPKSREVFLDRQSQPFGMALLGNTFYVGNTDGVMAFDHDARCHAADRPGPAPVHLQARRPLDAQPAAQCRRHASCTPAWAR